MIKDAVKLIKADTVDELQYAIDTWLDEQYDEVNKATGSSFGPSFNIESVQVQATLWPDKETGSFLCAVIVYSYE